MKEQRTKIITALICALLLASFTCAVFLPLFHDCSGELCEVCTAVKPLDSAFGGIILLAAFCLCVEMEKAVRLETKRAAVGAEATPISLKVKLSD